MALWPLLVGLEDGATYPFEDAHAQIRRGVERAQIPFVDLLPALRGRSTASLWVHESDLHPNEVAQELVAPVLDAVRPGPRRRERPGALPAAERGRRPRGVHDAVAEQVVGRRRLAGRARSASRISAAVRVGWICTSRAATPAVSGHENDVPLTSR